ncbi:hypothetical protein PVAND_013251 [Polypedilum vanderplanki]|uniref:Uncharacterized protein n=1 Tax=Polypedilum vanderplanki TaxID=319348 RepID=A0A9J6CQV8_POLVA|nr:hypothetical protein PVAND_013251 [Polypedilum vanderplanki]
MENQQKIINENYAYHTVPKVSIDGRSHGDLLLIAIGTGAAFAVVILIVLISLIRHKKKETIEEIKAEIIETPSGNFTLTKNSNDSNLSPSPENQKSNLMFKYFGRSLSSFDTEKSYTNTDCIAINIEIDNQKQIYRKHVLAPNEILNNTFRDKYIQTIAV